MLKLIYNKRKYHRKVIRKALYFHIVCLITLLTVCLTFASWLGVWQNIEQGRLTVAVVLVAGALLVFAATFYSFFRWIFKTASDLERAVNVLQSEAKKTDLEYSDLLSDSKQNLTDLLQILLQREAAAQIITKQAELEVLTSQINPHFLYNTLETIRGQALHSGESKIAETTKALADIFRYSISKKGAMIQLHDELDNIKNYFKIQQIRFDNRFELKLKIDDDVGQIQIPKLLVQPVIENALKHGLEPKSGEGCIVITAFRTEYRLEITVEDDGIGMSVEELTMLNAKLAGAESFIDIQNNNIGLYNINERIKMVYGQEYGISVISARQIGTKVTLSLGIFMSGEV